MHILQTLYLPGIGFTVSTGNKKPVAASFTEENKKILEKIVVACLKPSPETRPAKEKSIIIIS